MTMSAGLTNSNSNSNSSSHSGAKAAEMGAGAGKSLQALLADLATVEASDERMIHGLSLDSRQTKANDLFIAIPGEASDGRDYIQSAIGNGAIAVAHEKNEKEKIKKSKSSKSKYSSANEFSVPSFDIASLQGHVGTIAARFFEHPSARMQLLGITGTNGKTTCAYLLAQALDNLGQRCALMGTIGNGFVDELQPSALTTSDALSTQRMLASLLSQGAAAVCVEVSSHGLAQQRVNHLEFDIAVFTNLSHDHLDYHGNMENYANAKQKLFQFSGLSCAVLNVDDEFGKQLMHKHRAANCISYGMHDGDVRLRNLELHDNGMAFEVEYNGQVARVQSSLIGAVNATNLLATIATLIACGFELTQIAENATTWRAAPGRMEWLRNHATQSTSSTSSPAVVIDYAHTPDALERALTSLAELCRGKLWVVFGCGGDRDHDKRQKMGKVAETLADQIIVTNDNPRSESPEKITEQIVSGMTVAAKENKAGKVSVIHDRRAAIETAIAKAAAEDIVLVAGKGHEPTQTIGTQVIELDDRKIAATALEGKS